MKGNKEKEIYFGSVRGKAKDDEEISDDNG